MNNKKILLVDDDEDDQLIFIDAVNEIEKGIECVVANDGLEALNYIKSTVSLPALIFLDLNMPFINGFEFLKRIKKDSRFQKIPVIILTTSDSLSDRNRAKEAGAERFLTKTPDFTLLKEKLNEIFSADFPEHEII